MVTGAGAIETGVDGSTYQSDDFSFAIPAGWAETKSRSEESYGQLASIATVAPEGSVPSNNLVNVIAFVRQPEEPPDNPRAWFDWYIRKFDAEVRQPASEIELDRVTALQGWVKWTDEAGNPIELRIIRAVRGDREYVIYCQAEPADPVAIAAGCETIVTSFRAT